MYRNKLNHLIRKAERKYYQDMLLENKSNLKKSWKILKGIINKRKYRSAVQEFDSNGTIIEDGEQIANKFNKFFVNVGSNLSRAIPKSNKDPRNFIQHTTYECFCVMPVNDEEGVKIISSFQDSSAGWDELKPGIIKNIKGCIALPLAHICNLSFKRGVFPMQLKIVKNYIQNTKVCAECSTTFKCIAWKEILHWNFTDVSFLSNMCQYQPSI